MSCYIPVLEKLRGLKKVGSCGPGNTNQSMTVHNQPPKPSKNEPIILKQSHFLPSNAAAGFNRGDMSYNRLDNSSGETRSAVEANRVALGGPRNAQQVRQRDSRGLTITQQV